MAQLVKNPPVMWETWVRSLGWEDPLEKGKATHSSILAWRIPWAVCIVHGVTKSQTQRSDFHFQFSVAHWYRICLSMQETRVPALLLEDPGSIPGSGRSPGEGIGYPLQDSWASLVAQLVKNPPAMQETWV